MAQPLQLFSNNAVSLLALPISATATSLTVMAGYGQQFPNPGQDEFFLITLENQTATHREIIRVTGRQGDVLSFLLSDRGQEGTEVRAWDASLGNDTLVDHRITAETMSLAMRLPIPGSVPAAGQEIIDSPFDLETSQDSADIVLPYEYVPNTTKVYVGGLRLKRNVDFTESGISKITLLFTLSQANVDDGSSIVVDYVVA